MTLLQNIGLSHLSSMCSIILSNLFFFLYNSQQLLYSQLAVILSLLALAIYFPFILRVCTLSQVFFVNIILTIILGKFAERQIDAVVLPLLTNEELLRMGLDDQERSRLLSAVEELYKQVKIRAT